MGGGRREESKGCFSGGNSVACSRDSDAKFSRPLVIPLPAAKGEIPQQSLRYLFNNIYKGGGGGEGIRKNNRKGEGGEGGDDNSNKRDQSVTFIIRRVSRKIIKGAACMLSASFRVTASSLQYASLSQRT